MIRNFRQHTKNLTAKVQKLTSTPSSNGLINSFVFLSDHIELCLFIIRTCFSLTLSSEVTSTVLECAFEHGWQMCLSQTCASSLTELYYLVL